MNLRTCIKLDTWVPLFLLTSFFASPTFADIAQIIKRGEEAQFPTGGLQTHGFSIAAEKYCKQYAGQGSKVYWYFPRMTEQSPAPHFKKIFCGSNQQVPEPFNQYEKEDGILNWISRHHSKVPQELVISIFDYLLLDSSLPQISSYHSQVRIQNIVLSRFKLDDSKNSELPEPLRGIISKSIPQSLSQIQEDIKNFSTPSWYYTDHQVVTYFALLAPYLKAFNAPFDVYVEYFEAMIRLTESSSHSIRSQVKEALGTSATVDSALFEMAQMIPGLLEQFDKKQLLRITKISSKMTENLFSFGTTDQKVFYDRLIPYFLSLKPTVDEIVLFFPVINQEAPAPLTLPLLKTAFEQITDFQDRMRIPPLSIDFSYQYFDSIFQVIRNRYKSPYDIRPSVDSWRENIERVSWRHDLAVNLKQKFDQTSKVIQGLIDQSEEEYRNQRHQEEQAKWNTYQARLKERKEAWNTGFSNVRSYADLRSLLERLQENHSLLPETSPDPKPVSDAILRAIQEDSRNIPNPIEFLTKIKAIGTRVQITEETKKKLAPYVFRVFHEAKGTLQTKYTLALKLNYLRSLSQTAVKKYESILSTEDLLKLTNLFLNSPDWDAKRPRVTRQLFFGMPSKAHDSPIPKRLLESVDRDHLKNELSIVNVLGVSLTSENSPFSYFEYYYPVAYVEASSRYILKETSWTFIKNVADLYHELSYAKQVNAFSPTFRPLRERLENEEWETEDLAYLALQDVLGLSRYSLTKHIDRKIEAAVAKESILSLKLLMMTLPEDSSLYRSPATDFRSAVETFLKDLQKSPSEDYLSHLVEWIKPLDLKGSHFKRFELQTLPNKSIELAQNRAQKMNQHIEKYALDYSFGSLLETAICSVKWSSQQKRQDFEGQLRGYYPKLKPVSEHACGMRNRFLKP